MRGARRARDPRFSTHPVAGLACILLFAAGVRVRVRCVCERKRVRFGVVDTGLEDIPKTQRSTTKPQNLDLRWRGGLSDRYMCNVSVDDDVCYC